MCSDFHKQRNIGIDVLRTIACFLVIVIHCWTEFNRVDETLSNILVSFSRLGVGVFFIVTGYFLTDMVQYGNGRRHILKLLNIVVMSTLLYLILNVVIHTLLGNGIGWFILGSMSFQRVVNFLIFNNSEIGPHFWYLWAIIYTLVACIYICRYGKKKALYWTALCCFICGLILSYMDFRIQQRSWLFYGFPFVVCGMYIRDKVKLFGRIKTRTLMIIFIICTLLVVLEAGLFQTNREYYILTLPMSACSLLIAIKDRNMKLKKPIIAVAYIGMKYSLYIFIFHIAVKRVLTMLFVEGGVFLYMVGYPIIIFSASLILSMLYLSMPARLRLF